MPDTYKLILVECLLAENSSFQQWLAQTMGSEEKALEARRNLPAVILEGTFNQVNVAQHVALQGWAWGLKLLMQASD